MLALTLIKQCKCEKPQQITLSLLEEPANTEDAPNVLHQTVCAAPGQTHTSKGYSYFYTTQVGPVSHILFVPSFKSAESIS